MAPSSTRAPGRTMTPFVHLRVASGYSLQYGASHPSALVARAAPLGLTDRDGLYGAIRFAKACLASGIAPVIGVDLAVPADVAPDGRPPGRGGPPPPRAPPGVGGPPRTKGGWAR